MQPVSQRPGSVEVRARDGTMWIAYERNCAVTPGARAPRCLVLESAGHARRLWYYPHDWRTRPIEELLALPIR
jgi:hypothetical protein